MCPGSWATSDLRQLALCGGIGLLTYQNQSPDVISGRNDAALDLEAFWF